MVGQPFFEGVVARVVATTASGLCRRAAPRASRAVPQGGAPQRQCLVAQPRVLLRSELEESVGRCTSRRRWTTEERATGM